jgi:hypothetical protein
MVKREERAPPAKRAKGGYEPTAKRHKGAADKPAPVIMNR